jgi:hypothetical protein
MCDYSPFCGQVDRDSTEAEVDGGGESVEIPEAVAAALDEPDLGVDAFQP